MYGTVAWAAKKAYEKTLVVAEIWMLRLMCVVTKMDRIRNERNKSYRSNESKISTKVQKKARTCHENG